MKKQFKMVLAYKHSYSREFGWPITETEPERYCKVYNLQIGPKCYDTAPLKIEYHSDSGKYHLFSRSERMDKVVSNRPWVFDARKEVEKAAIAYYKDYQKLDQATNVLFK